MYFFANRRERACRIGSGELLPRTEEIVISKVHLSIAIDSRIALKLITTRLANNAKNSGFKEWNQFFHCDSLPSQISTFTHAHILSVELGRVNKQQEVSQFQSVHNTLGKHPIHLSKTTLNSETP